MLALHVYASDATLAGARAVLVGHPGVEHVVQVGDPSPGELSLVMADVDAVIVDTLLPELLACGVDGDDIELVHRESNRPLGTSHAGDIPAWSGGALAWTELAMVSRQYARAVPQYLVFMASAGVIAAFGVLTSNSILIIGAMAISPDLLPMCATCVGLADRRPRLAGRAFAALVVVSPAPD
jgi:hypothetical protein